MAEAKSVLLCTCPHLHLGHEVLEQRNWNPECGEHGMRSDWYRSPEQTAKREADNEKLRDLQQHARERRAGLSRPGDRDPETGRPMYEVCSRCNYDRHTCPGCGTSLLHGQEVCAECTKL